MLLLCSVRHSCLSIACTLTSHVCATALLQVTTISFARYIPFATYNVPSKRGHTKNMSFRNQARLSAGLFHQVIFDTNVATRQCGLHISALTGVSSTPRLRCRFIQYTAYIQPRSYFLVWQQKTKTKPDAKNANVSPPQCTSRCCCLKHAIYTGNIY